MKVRKKHHEVFSIKNQGVTVDEVTKLKRKQQIFNRTITALPFVNLSTSEKNISVWYHKVNNELIALFLNLYREGKYIAQIFQGI